MSKKDKSKFHKRIKAQLLEEMSQTTGMQKVAMPTPTRTVTPTTTTPISTPKKITPPMPAQTQVASTSSVVQATNESLTYIKRDLKKSAIIISSIIILIIALSIIDAKTNILLQAGNHLFNVLHIAS